MESNSVGAAADAVSSSLPLLAAITLTSLVAVWAMIHFFVIVRRLERAMGAPCLKEYTFATALYPDALIVKFGAEERYRTLSSRIKFTNVGWARMRWHLEKKLVNVIYANRRTAGDAIALNPHIIASERPLCIYRGFAIGVKPSAVTSGSQKLTLDLFATMLKEAPDALILVQRDTDQHRSLRKLLFKVVAQVTDLTGNRLKKRVEAHIQAIPPDSDLLELMWTFDPLSDETAPSIPDGTANVIGFAGGLTERVIAKRLGYGIIGPADAEAEDYAEINSFVYCSPPDGSDDDLPKMLQEVEHLWEDTVTKILNEPHTQECFREFLNSQIRTQLGPGTLARLGDQPVFSNEDMVDFLSKWVRFPRHGPPIIGWIAPDSAR